MKFAEQVMIVSYETFRMHADKFQSPGSCDLLICDEAHRLKNDQTLTNKVKCHPTKPLNYCSDEPSHILCDNASYISPKSLRTKVLQAATL